MAIVFKVEDGTGLSDATSYTSVEDADDYLSLKVNLSDTWIALDSDVKEEYLMWATRILDQRTTWKGVKVVQDSALAWPRSGVLDKEGYPIPPDVVPKQVKDATAEVAYNLFKQAVDPSAPNNNANSGIKSLKADVLEIVYRDGQLPIQNNFPVGLNDLLWPLGSFRGNGLCGVGRVLRG